MARLCRHVRIAVELDGGQHFGDPDVHRRDRRKDASLQENGYLVPRFLAEGIGKRLDHAPDTVLRPLGGRSPNAVTMVAPSSPSAVSGESADEARSSTPVVRLAPSERA